MGVVDLRQYLRRKLPSNAFAEAMIEPLMFPEQRKKKVEAMNKKQIEEYFESLTHFNPTGAPKQKRRFRVEKEVKKVVTKRTKERKKPSDLSMLEV